MPIKKKSALQKRKDNKYSAYWRKKADELFSIIIRNKANNKCEVCGSDKYNQTHHLIPRQENETRHTINNGIALCHFCHKWSKYKSFHSNPLLVYEWLKENCAEKYNFVKGYCEKQLKSKSTKKKAATNWKEHYDRLKELEKKGI